MLHTPGVHVRAEVADNIHVRAEVADNIEAATGGDIGVEVVVDVVAVDDDRREAVVRVVVKSSVILN